MLQCLLWNADELTSLEQGWACAQSLRMWCVSGPAELPQAAKLFFFFSRIESYALEFLSTSSLPPHCAADPIYPIWSYACYTCKHCPNKLTGVVSTCLPAIDLTLFAHIRDFNKKWHLREAISNTKFSLNKQHQHYHREVLLYRPYRKGQYCTVLHYNWLNVDE